MATFVLTVIGDDRAGLVNTLAAIVDDHGGNWGRSQMAELAGKFAGIVLVTVPDRRADDMLSCLDSLDGVLDVQVRRGVDDPVHSTRVRLVMVCTDRPGIVREISAALARLGVNIDTLVTSTREAPMAGGVLFDAEAVLDLPDGADVDDVRSAVEGVADELMVDVDIDRL